MEIKPTHKAVKDYYLEMKRLEGQGVIHELAIRQPFYKLLDNTSRANRLTLIHELSQKISTGKRIQPDAVVKDEFQIVKGYWEAKDTADDLEKEIISKISKGYPLTNIIFEDSETAVLIQDKQEVMRIDMNDPGKLSDLLNRFFEYTEPPIENFHKAVEEFKDRVPELGKGLAEIIKQAHQDNQAFQSAFDGFFNLCRTSLNPNIRREAVDEMLIQHLLTERIIRKVFGNADFFRRNIIAREVEKVIAALVSKSFNRDEFLKKLDRFYIAIEDAAHQINDFNEKQQFINTVYEKFFQGFAVKVADTHGIVYTPQPVVDFMVNSVEAVLQKEFGKELGSEGVNILDPATGTGGFIVKIIEKLNGRDVQRVYREQLFANEVMLMPYYIASLNIEHAYFEKKGEYEPFKGICFVDTLDLVPGKQQDLLISEANTERIERQRSTPITVIIGNPPYNAGQQNENDNNKNRTHKEIEDKIRQTYVKDSKATLKSALWDVYVKFFRWATDRLNGRDGIVCFVSNNSFVDDIAFDGMRKHLAQDFNCIYVFDLKGNVRKDSMREGIPIGEKHTIFGLAAMVGISIAVCIKKKGLEPGIYYHTVDWKATREEKFNELNKYSSHVYIKWNTLKPNTQYLWLTSDNYLSFQKYNPLIYKNKKPVNTKSLNPIFYQSSTGISSGRDSIVINFSIKCLEKNIAEFVSRYSAELDRYNRIGVKDKIDDQVDYSIIKWSRNLKRVLQSKRTLHEDKRNFRYSIYRPFTKKYIYFQRHFIDEVGRNPKIFPNIQKELLNNTICMSGIGRSRPFHTLMTRLIPNYDLLEKTQCFPFYTYDEDGSNRRENITDWALSQFREHYRDDSIGKWDIFYYVYGLLHHPGYRADFADCLRRELPRIPYAPDFRGFCEAGRKLGELHLNYEEIEPYPLQWEEAEGRPLSFNVKKMKLSKDKLSLIVNDTLTLHGIPEEVYDYKLGNKSALHWIIDQYQIKTDKRSGIVSDPNNPDDERYIVNLAGRVIAVSLETVKIVENLPKEYTSDNA